jgi:hypothetical protein
MVTGDPLMTNGTPPRPASYDKKVGLVLQGGGALGNRRCTTAEFDRTTRVRLQSNRLTNKDCISSNERMRTPAKVHQERNTCLN